MTARGVRYKKRISSRRITVSCNKRQHAGLLTVALPDKRLRSAEGSQRGTGEPGEVSQPSGRRSVTSRGPMAFHRDGKQAE